MRIHCTIKRIILLSIIISNCLLLCQSELLIWLKESEILHLYPGELIFSPGCPKKFWQLLMLFLPLQKMDELMKTDKRNYLLFPWTLGWKLIVFLDGTGRWTMLWCQSFPQLSHWTSAEKSFWEIFKLPLWLDTQERTPLTPLKWQTVPKYSSHFFSCLYSILCNPGISFLLTKIISVFIYEF